MAKLVIIFDNALSKEGSHLTNYHRLVSNLKSNENGKKYYQGFQLKHFNRATHSVQEQYLSSVANICTNVEERFSDIKKSAIFKILNLYWILSLGLLRKIAVFLAMIPSKKSMSILRSFLLRMAVISQKFAVSGLC